ncbi:TPA: 50S ribosomal protein L14e [Candidatus Woesearchaeota archaeon]|nr:50S ribosomal protein L14e [archaeon]HIJ11744.1 50S ribosomal protein L14e [Candidatus Woesearchaeota archaeon]|tara:strand:- start:166 stop:585 length:420 start_codon:yes stop_codon:yes gene_type:complete
MIFDVGRVCVKLAGRDAGQRCVVVDVLKDGYVLVDGATRRRKVNVRHLEPLSETLNVSKGASHDDVKKVFDGTRDTKAKKASERPKKQKKVKAKKEKKAAPKKEAKVEKKDVPKVEETKAEQVKEVKSEEKKEVPKAEA